MHTNHISLLCLALLLVPACGPKKKAKKPLGVQFFVHGDPKQLIAGAKLDENSPLSLDNIKNFNGFHISTTFVFIEKEEVVNPKDWAAVEAQNSTDSDEDSTFDLAPYTFVEQNSKRIEFSADNGKNSSFGFSLSPKGNLEMTDIDNFPVKPLHYSLKNDGKAFSILAEFDDKRYGRGLYEVVFASSSEIKPALAAAQNYAYLFDNLQIKWEEDIKIDVCGALDAKQKKSVEKSVKAWLDPLPLNSNLSAKVSLGFKSEFKPFSDLNEHCLQLISNFKLEKSTNFYTAGVTLPALNLASKVQIDSDIFIFLDHVAKEMNGHESPTTTHELGHFFGLGHEFKKDEAGLVLHPSIMGYSQGTSFVTEYDLAAIKALYGKDLSLASEVQPD